MQPIFKQIPTPSLQYIYQAIHPTPSANMINYFPMKEMQSYENCPVCIKQIEALKSYYTIPPVQQACTISPNCCSSLEYYKDSLPNSVGIYGKDGCFYPVFRSPQSVSHYIKMHQKYLNSMPELKLKDDKELNSAVILQKPPEPVNQHLTSIDKASLVEDLYEPLNPPRLPSSRPLLLGLRPSKHAPSACVPQKSGTSRMDLSFGKRFFYPTFETQNFSSYLPILPPHQFVSQSSTIPLLSPFPSSQLSNGVIPASPYSLTWHQTGNLFSQHPSVLQDTPTHLPQQTNFPGDLARLSRIPNSFHLQTDSSKGMDHLNGAKSLLIQSAAPNSANDGYRNMYENDPNSHHDFYSLNHLNNFGQCGSRKIRVIDKISCPIVPLPKMPKSSFQVGYYVPPAVDPGDLYGGLNEVWTQHFDFLFSSFNKFSHCWTFGPTTEPLRGWATYRDMAKVRFSCQKCKHGWTSMHGVVVFYYRFESISGRGQVCFILTGQKCAQCHTDSFETPMWYPEEAQKAMTNLYHEIASKIYNLETPPPIRDRRHGRPRQQHVASSCQGCYLGICKSPSVSSTPGSIASSSPSSGSEELIR